MRMTAYRGPATLRYNDSDVPGLAHIGLIGEDRWEGEFEADDIDTFGAFGGNFTLTLGSGEVCQVLVTGGLLQGGKAHLTGSGPWPLRQ